MMTLLHRFAALALILSVLSSLLPEGTLRRTALMAAGLIVALCWMEGLWEALDLPDVPAAPATVLTQSAADTTDLSAAMDVYARQAERAASHDKER